MKKVKIICSYDLKDNFEIIPDKFCPQDSLYMFLDESPKTKNLLLEINNLKKELLRQNKRYNNVLKGLNYFKGKVSE